MLTLAGCGGGGGDSYYIPPVQDKNDTVIIDNYIGAGTVSDSFKIFGNGFVPVFGSSWTYYKMLHKGNDNCTYKVIFPVHVTNVVLTDDELVDINFTWKNNVMIYEANTSALIDCYSLADGEIEVYTDCFDEIR